MELEQALLKRRSIRKFLPEKVVKENIDKLLHAGMSGPSACNLRPWEFYVVENKEVLNSLKSASKFTCIDAPLAIIVCGDINKTIPNENNYLFWVEDTSAASENILLEATSLGLGSLWCGIYPNNKFVENVKKILELDVNIIPLNIIYLGFPDETAPERDQYDEKKIHYIR